MNGTKNREADRRSDNDEWKKAYEFKELEGVLIINPPQTPKEQKIDSLKQKFRFKLLKQIIPFYIFTLVVVSVFSFIKAQSSWNKYLKDTEGKYLITNEISPVEKGRPPLITQEEYNAILNDPKSDVFDKLRAASDMSDFTNNNDGFITYYELNDNKRYPYYTKGINNETNYSDKQGFLFRPYKAFYSTIYLRDEEQNNSLKLFLNLSISSLLSLSLVFIVISGFYYIIKRANIK